MPSLAEAPDRGRIRLWLERAAHLAGIAIILWFLIDSLWTRPGANAEAVEVGALPAELRRWSTTASPHRVHLQVDGAIQPAHRDWLAAIAAAGSEVTWNGDSVMPLAIALDPVADPDGGTRVRVAAPAGTTVVLEDDLGAMDSVSAGSAGAQFLTYSPLAAGRVRSGSFTAAGVVRDSLEFGRLLVVGRVNWESAMVVAALEERGWEVDAILALSPKGDVKQGAPVERIDPDRYSAVVLLDSVSLVSATQLIRYVRNGGGLVMTARTNASPALAPLRVGRIGATVPATEPFDTTFPMPQRSLALTSILPEGDAVPLERRDHLVAVAARRVERGRVAVIGYDDTWRWRMAGGRNGLEDYRAWWATVVAGVANVRHFPIDQSRLADETPLATLVDRLGPPAELPTHARRRPAHMQAWLFGALAALLLAQWLSRRLRGAP